MLSPKRGILSGGEKHFRHLFSLRPAYIPRVMLNGLYQGIADCSS